MRRQLRWRLRRLQVIPHICNHFPYICIVLNDKIMKKTKMAIAALMLTVMAMSVVGCSKPEDEEEGDIVVTTIVPTNITQTGADLGGKVSVSGDIEPQSLGVCWSVDANPTARGLNCYYRETDNWNAPFACTITNLEPNTTYHVRAYAYYLGYYYGEDVTFTTETNVTYTEGTLNGYTWIDLGLPSGTLWATCNVGANDPWEIGGYFAWGETSTKDYYNSDTYKYGVIDGAYYLSKYCPNANYGYQGYTDSRTVLEAEDDAATIKWGAGWRTPTKEEIKELYDNTTSVWTTEHGINGRRITSSNGGSIFLPAGGYIDGYDTHYLGQHGEYWSSSLYTERPYQAWLLVVDNEYFSPSSRGGRKNGYTVRPVCKH